MKQVLVATATLALAATMAAQAQVSLRPGGAVVPPTPAARAGSEPVSSEVQLRELRARLEALDKRVAELERKQAPPEASGANNALDPTRLRPQQPR